MKIILLLVVLFIWEGSSAQQGDMATANKRTTVLQKAYVESEFPGGLSAWYRFLMKNLRYPSNAMRDRIEGTVVVQFMVDKKGRVTNVTALVGPKVLKKEAERLIKQSGRWIPAKKDGEPIISYKKQSLAFKLTN